VYEDDFVLFVFFVVKLILGCGRRLRVISASSAVKL
jgi:hypothetical protein